MTTDIASNKYVSLTTFTKAGVAKSTPVWIAQLPDGRVGFTTSATSWKVKRIGNDPKVTLRPSNSQGKVAPDATEVTGRAEVIHGLAIAEVHDLVKQKYGIWVPVIQFVEKVSALVSRKPRGAECAVVVTLD